ncbi:MAG: hypothetical protein ACTSR2_03185, partial [Candidatus Hodarchaeales archaeon]
IEKILDDTAFFSSIIVYLNSQGVELQKNTINIITDNKDSIPELNLEWIEVLLTGLLFTYYNDKNPVEFLIHQNYLHE